MWAWETTCEGMLCTAVSANECWCSWQFSGAVVCLRDLTQLCGSCWKCLNSVNMWTVKVKITTLSDLNEPMICCDVMQELCCQCRKMRIISKMYFTYQKYSSCRKCPLWLMNYYMWHYYIDTDASVCQQHFTVVAAGCGATLNYFIYS